MLMVSTNRTANGGFLRVSPRSQVSRPSMTESSKSVDDRSWGEDARENGFDSTAIPLSTKANGYATAGMGFQKIGGEHRRVRFHFVSAEEIAELIRSFPKERQD